VKSHSEGWFDSVAAWAGERTASYLPQLSLLTFSPLRSLLGSEFYILLTYKALKVGDEPIASNDTRCVWLHASVVALGSTEALSTDPSAFQPIVVHAQSLCAA
jgi:hypothetical protein